MPSAAAAVEPKTYRFQPEQIQAVNWLLRPEQEQLQQQLEWQQIPPEDQQELTVLIGTHQRKFTPTCTSLAGGYLLLRGLNQEVLITLSGKPLIWADEWEGLRQARPETLTHRKEKPNK